MTKNEQLSPSGKIPYTETKTVVPLPAQLEESRVVAHLETEHGSAFRILRSQILSKLRKHGLSNFAVVGASPGVGKTTVACNIALSISQSPEHTALLVDLDLRRPSVSRTFGINSIHGVADYFEGREDLCDILLNPGFDCLTIAPANPVEKPAELLSSEATASFVTEVSSRYKDRVVVFDLPPLLGIADALAVLPLVDAVLVVVEEGATTDDEIRETKRLLAQSKILGAVLNKSATAQNISYYYYYSS